MTTIPIEEERIGEEPPLWAVSLIRGTIARWNSQYGTSIPMPALTWVTDAKEEATGWSMAKRYEGDTGLIFIHANRDMEDTSVTILHEVAHLVCRAMGIESGGNVFMRIPHTEAYWQIAEQLYAWEQRPSDKALVQGWESM